MAEKQFSDIVKREYRKGEKAE
jgi:hypothetical protein